MTINPQADQWLNANAGAVYPAVAFEQPGYMVKGRVAEVPRIVTTPSLNGTGDEESYVISIDVLPGSQVVVGKSGERVAAQPGMRVSIWIRKGAFANALAAAISKAGASGLAVGGTLAVRRDADGQGKPGMTAPHMFTVQYAAPVAETVMPASMLGGPFDGGQVTMPQAPAQAPAADMFAGQQQAPAPSGGDLF